MHEQYERIQHDLRRVEDEEDVKVLLAVESGSRAWGFASPDSDYDVRFIYCHRQDRYLTIEPFRDVIERPITDEIDLAGWDIRKALVLFRKSNPPLLEWLNCSIVYRTHTPFASSLRAMADEQFSRRRSFWHYLHMAEGNLKDALQGDTVRHKKYFYVLRPILAMQWLEEGRGPVPIEFDRLLDAGLPDGYVREAIDALLVVKQRSPESMVGTAIPAIHDYIERQLQRLRTIADSQPHTDIGIEPLNALFRKTIIDAWM